MIGWLFGLYIRAGDQVTTSPKIHPKCVLLGRKGGRCLIVDVLRNGRVICERGTLFESSWPPRTLLGEVVAWGEI